MAETKTQVQPWAYRPSDDDSPEVKEAAYLDENVDVSKVDVSGKFINDAVCHFVMGLDNGCIINEKAVTIRSCQLKKEQEKDERSVKISVRIGNEYYRFSIFFESVNDALKVLNTCRRALHSAGVKIDYLNPLWEGMLQVDMVSLTTDLGSSPDKPIPSYVAVLDEEALHLYEDSNSETPKFYLQFYKEATENSMEKAIIQHSEDMLILESSKWKFVINKATEHAEFTQALKNVRPKPAVVFETLTALGNFLQEKTYTPGGVDPILVPKSFKYREGSAHTPYYHGTEDWDADAKLKHEAAILANEFDRAVSEYSSKEELSLPWVVAEEEIRQILANSESLGDSDNDMLSGGLDPNNSDHLRRSFDQIKEHIKQQRYDLALSRLQGTKIIFMDSRVREIQALVNQGDVELMKKLYYHSFA